MNPVRPLRPALLALALAACGPLPGDDGIVDPLAVLGDRRGAWVDAERDAHRAFSAGEWEAAARALERMVSLVPAASRERPLDPVLGRRVKTALYNLACARALGGRTAAALDAMEQAVGDGYGDIGFDHLVEDPDLASLRQEPRYRRLLAHLSWNEEVVLLPPRPGGPGPFPVVVEIVDSGDAERVPEPHAYDGVPAAITAVPYPPYRERPGKFVWTTRLDPGKSAAEKALQAVRRAEKEFPADPARRVLCAHGARAVRLAWEVLLRKPEVFAAAVLEGPSPPDWALLDRGAARIRTAVFAAGPEGIPGAAVGVRVEDAGSAAEALRRALR